MRHISRITLVALIAILSLQRSVLEPGDETERVRAFTRQIEFDYLTWTLDALLDKFAQIGLGTTDFLAPDDRSQIVLDYLDLVGRIFETEGYLDDFFTDPQITNPELASQPLRKQLDQLYRQRRHLTPLAEAIFQYQLNAIAADLGLTLGGQSIPPVLYQAAPLPLALIVSPREVIRQDANISLQYEFTTDQRAALETRVDQALNVSSLVVNIGGVGMYPTMVIQTTDINWLAEVVAHEWIHNFLTLRPLGASYTKNIEMRIINETTANIAGKEIRAALIQRYYPEFVPPPPQPVAESSEASIVESELPIFDFRAEMHETRLHVDQLLTDGKIEEAEAYMEARRHIFVENGYPIRKLNQAYFAFHGAYADIPGGAAGVVEDPVGAAVRALRAQSLSLAAFVNRISWIWSFEQLQAVVEATP